MSECEHEWRFENFSGRCLMVALPGQTAREAGWSTNLRCVRCNAYKSQPAMPGDVGRYARAVIEEIDLELAYRKPDGEPQK